MSEETANALLDYIEAIARQTVADHIHAAHGGEATKTKAEVARLRREVLAKLVSG